jgi:ketosteroid isomerase-like protein
MTRKILVLGLVCAAFAAFGAAAEPLAPKSASRADVETYIRACEEQWAAGNADAAKDFLADDYQGVSSSGLVVDKAYQIADMTGPSPFSATRLDYINFRHYGSLIIVQGAESLDFADGRPQRRLIWTDIWMNRKGRWQIITSQDSRRPPEQSDDADTIRKQRLAYNGAIQARNPAAMADFLAPEMVELTSTGALNSTAATVIKDYENVEFKDPQFIAYDRWPDSIEVSADGRFAVERGDWHGRFKDDKGAVSGNGGRYQAGWIKRDGQWKIRTEGYVKLTCAKADDCR